MWLQHDNWSELHYSSVTQYSISYSIWPFLEGLAALFLVFFCLTCPHILLSKLALVKLEILERSVIENWPLEVLAKNICSEKNNRTENVGGQFLDRDFVRKKRRKVEKRKSRKDGRESKASYYDKMIYNYWIRYINLLSMLYWWWKKNSPVTIVMCLRWGPLPFGKVPNFKAFIF